MVLCYNPHQNIVETMLSFLLGYDLSIEGAFKSGLQNKVYLKLLEMHGCVYDRLQSKPSLVEV